MQTGGAANQKAFGNAIVGERLIAPLAVLFVAPVATVNESIAQLPLLHTLVEAFALELSLRVTASWDRCQRAKLAALGTR